MVNFSRTNSCDHDSFGISSKRILQEPCEDWIAIWNKRLQQKKTKKISVKTPTISSHEYIMCSLRTPLHDIWFDSGVTTTYEWNEDPPAPSRWMNAEWAVIISRKNGAKNSWKYHSFFFCKNGHFLLQNTLILDFEVCNCGKLSKYTRNGTLFQF